jgi:hypothetical protein
MVGTALTRLCPPYEAFAGRREAKKEKWRREIIAAPLPLA